MTETMQDELSPKPDHVPDHLVFDFDVYKDPRIKDDIQKGLMSLHRDAPDVFWSPRYGGHWMATRFDDVTTVGTNPAIFSSRSQTIIPVEEGQEPFFAPQSMDAPDHIRHRLLLLKFLAPKHLKQQEPFVRKLAIELIEKFKATGGGDFKKEVAVFLPVTVFMTMMQWDTSRLYEMTRWAHDILSSDDNDARLGAYDSMNNFIASFVQDKIENPGDDPISLLLDSEINGEPVTPQRVREMAALLFQAGLDTVTNAMTYMLYYLAQDQAMQHRLRSEPDKIPDAVEEFLRRFSFVVTVRRLTQDYQLGDAPLKAGERIFCALGAASNDERSVSHPELVDLDRPKCPHVAFMAGPHNCVGSPLARLELRVLLEEWLARMPDVSLAPGFKPVTHGGAVATIDRLDLVW